MMVRALMGKVGGDIPWDFLELGMLFFFLYKKKNQELVLILFCTRVLEGNKENLNF